MPFLTDNDIDERVSSSENLINRLTIHEISRGKPEGSVEVPSQIKKVIAIIGNEDNDETCRSLAKTFDIGKSTVNEIENGRSTKVPELKELVRTTKSKVEQNRETAESAAVETLLTSLNLIPGLLVNTKKPKVLSGIAKDMAIIANQMANKNTGPDGNAPAMHLHLYAPKQKEVKDYEIIDV
jgi:hypothetical protein